MQTPPCSKNAIKKIGQRVANNTYTLEDIVILDKWRLSHHYVLNAFQSWIKNNIKNQDIFFVQRLKRKATIIDKLVTKRCLDLSTLNDIAGCRLIFNNMRQLYKFRDQLHRSRAKHTLKYDQGKYDYVSMPKEDGYRGIHDVFQYIPTSSNRSPWKGLPVEIQYRTKVQHMWATAVEMTDYIKGTRLKFDEKKTLEFEFFKLCSELLARQEENTVSCYKEKSIDNIKKELKEINLESDILNILSGLKSQKIHNNKFGKYNVFSIDEKEKLNVKKFRSVNLAINFLFEEEKRKDVSNTVFVKSDKPQSLRKAYNNYFNDARDFISKIESLI